MEVDTDPAAPADPSTSFLHRRSSEEPPDSPTGDDITFADDEENGSPSFSGPERLSPS
jgi:hypothetical protein